MQPSGNQALSTLYYHNCLITYSSHKKCKNCQVHIVNGSIHNTPTRSKFLLGYPTSPVSFVAPACLPEVRIRPARPASGVCWPPKYSIGKSAVAVSRIQRIQYGYHWNPHPQQIVYTHTNLLPGFFALCAQTANMPRCSYHMLPSSSRISPNIWQLNGIVLRMVQLRQTREKS